MLALFRRKRQGLKWTLWVVIVALGAGMVLLFVDSPGGAGGPIGAQNIASVDGRPVSALAFRRRYDRLYETYRQIYRLDEQDPNVVRQLGLGRQAGDQLIKEYVVLLEAERMGIGATEEEVRERIARFPSFQENGRFRISRYQEVLRLNNFTPEEFEGDIRREIAGQKLQRIISDGILVTPEEVEKEFLDRNQEVKVRYVAIDPEQLSEMAVEEEELRKYFENNKESFKVGEQRKVRYVKVATDPNTVEVTDEQIQARIEVLSEKEQVRASHILIRFEGDEEAEARKRAGEILRKVQSGQDFAGLARQYSQDETTAEKGGDLGFFQRGQLVPEFETAAFSLQPGDVSDLVKTPFGFHIIKTTEKPGSDPKARRPLAEFEVRQQEADKVTRNLATRIAYELNKGSELEEVAQSQGLSVQESPYFGLGDPITGLLVRNDFNQKVFALEKGDVVAPYQASGNYIVGELADIKLPEAPLFEPLRNRVEEAFKESRREERAREKAYEFYRAAKGSSFEQKARAQGLSVTTTGFFKKGATVDDTLKFSPELHSRAFGMDVGQISAPIEIAGKDIVFTVVEKSEVDSQKLEEERAQITDTLSTRKRSQFFSDYVQNLVDRLDAEDKIEIDQQRIDAITG